MKNRTLTMVLCLLLCIGTIMTGCNSTNESKESNNAKTSTTTDDASQRGLIVSIDTASNQVTIRTMGGFFNGSSDFKPGENADWSANGEKPQMPDGAKIPDGVQGGTTSQTYSISDKTVITNKDGKSITLADLHENDFDTFTEKDGVLLTLSISEFNGKSGMMTPPNGNSSKPSENSADAQ